MIIKPVRCRPGRLLLVAAFLVSACQPLPQPFAEDRPPVGDPMLAVEDGAGILVQPVTGASAVAGTGLAEAMAAALQDQDVPASTRSGNRHSYTLAATARETPIRPPAMPVPALAKPKAEAIPRPEPKPQFQTAKNLSKNKPKPERKSALDLEWVLSTPAGAVTGRHRQHIEIFAEPWHRGDPRLMETLAKSAAPGIAALLGSDMPVAVAHAQLHVLVPPVQGAPGDGPRTLSKAMVGALETAHYDTEAGALPKNGEKNEAYIVAGTVQLLPAGTGKETVKISWLLLAPDGTQIGNVDQENTVPAGSLNGAWGDIAYAVATAAADGIAALLEKVKSLSAAR